jgi:hypothetical protein
MTKAAIKRVSSKGSRRRWNYTARKSYFRLFTLAGLDYYTQPMSPCHTDILRLDDWMLRGHNTAGRLLWEVP